MTRYLLDTNTVSYLMRNHPAVIARMREVKPDDIAISAITRAELLYGLAKRPEAVKIAEHVHLFIASVTTQDWTASVAEHYATLRVNMEVQGISLSPNDLLIAAHAGALGAAVVTSDKAFARVPGLRVDDWSI